MRLSSLGLLLLGGLSACSSDVQQETPTGVPSSALRSEGAPTSLDFRDSFAAYFSRSTPQTPHVLKPAIVGEKHGAGKPYTEADLQTLIHVARPEIDADTPLRSLPVGTSAEEALRLLDRHFESALPSGQYEHGKRPFRAIENPDAILQKAGPVTIVVVPGIFGEFIKTFPFMEIYESDSAFKREFASKLAANPMTDRLFVDAKVDYDEVSLDRVFTVGSIDDAEGRALINVVFLQANMGSLETFGTLEQNWETYKSRLDKFFALMGLPERFYMLGYSRGALVALDIASRATDAREVMAHPWLTHVAGAVTLGGVVYGTPMADTVNHLDAEARGEPILDNPLNHMMRELVSVGEKLKSCSGEDSLTKLRVVKENSAVWSKALPRLIERFGQMQFASTKQSIVEGVLTPNDTKYDFGRMLVGAVMHDPFGAPKTLGETLQQLFSGKEVLRPDAPALVPGLELLGDVFETTVNPLRAVTQYCANVDRWKMLVRRIADGAIIMRTDDRLEWWRTHTFPKGFKLFSISGTQGDPQLPLGQNREIVETLSRNPLAYFVKSQDFTSLRSNYFELLSVSKQRLNDGQVPYSRSRFRSELNLLLNPAHAETEVYDLALLGTHHWGFAFPQAVPMSEGRNPFPRTATMYALGRFIAQLDLAGR